MNNDDLPCKYEHGYKNVTPLKLLLLNLVNGTLLSR